MPLLTPEMLAEIRRDAEFTRDRVGAPGSDVRKRAEAVLELLDVGSMMAEALKVAHGAIASLPAGVFGEASDGELVWPVRDELLDCIGKALRAAGIEVPS